MKTRPGRPKTEVAAYYFPAWHQCPKNDQWKGIGFTEWDLVKAAKPRFPGHRQPLIPEWGYFDESDPAVMRRACDTAKAHGIDTFIFDWYWYENAPFLNGAIDRGYLQLENPSVRFALMWANHTWRDVFPSDGTLPLKHFAWANVCAEEFVRISDDWIERYFSHSAYWRINGAAYFSFFAFDLFVEWMGGLLATRNVLDDFRDRARKAGVGELHLNVPGAGQVSLDVNPQRLIKVGLDSYTDYNWSRDLPRDQGLKVPYATWRAAGQASWDRTLERMPLPFAPNVSMGWDSTARVAQDFELVVSDWPMLPVVVDNSPREFGESVRDALRFVSERDRCAPYITINAWNEWTEGSYLEPDTEFGMQ
ncbi:MAG: glycoside hydrolase family 99-like domain-containing protein, partial [Bryobacteraceae bacterium]|nr:glycoside hydrolase family 99-like domain-containing protein [Bryobacteraceae bacterium]